MSEYDFKNIESKWQEKWAKEKYGQSADFDDKPKHYHLVEFPYPSGAGLHVGHLMGYGASDAYCRMKRLQGYNVMFPIGWDAFGLPTENFAIKNKIKPQKATADNIANFKKQIHSLGFSFDWSREIDTTDPSYYRWTQWIFLQFYKHGIKDGKLIEIADDDHYTPRLAYQAEMPVNWCPSCKINLANEEVIDGKCERCGTETEKRLQKQWMLRITEYADRLIRDLDSVDYLEKIKTQQINWIGKSTGANLRFQVDGYSNTVHDEEIEFYTTRPDTFFGTTFVVVSPEHPILEKLGYHIQNYHEIKEYVAAAAKKSELERTELQKDKTGVKCYGVYAVNPLNGDQIDIWVADYVLMGYGTGAVIGVPAHDQRDYEFAIKHHIPIKWVVVPHIIDEGNKPREDKKTVKRKMVHGIIYDPKTNKFLTLKWAKFGWHTFVLGGVDDGESLEQAARREILEETGYKNLKLMREIPGALVEYFAAHKDENRLADSSAVYFELIDDEKIEVAAEELAKHTPVWVDRAHLTSKNMTCSELDIWLDGVDDKGAAFVGRGVLINSGEFDGLDSEEAKIKITEKLKSVGVGDFATNYKLRDWIFSRQHYWGEPIPIVHCDKCGMVPLDEKDLPLILPDVENYEPSDTGESPLSKITDWVETTCPKCGGKAERETDTMPNWAGSSWYYLAYCMHKNIIDCHSCESRNPEKGMDPRVISLGEAEPRRKPEDDNVFVESKKELKYWMPVDIYNGGMEHTTLHLLYSRFWHKFLYDLGVVPTAEPYAKRIAHGIILGPDGRKMSKSFGNVINPDDIVRDYGADTLRGYVMFIGPYDQESAWSMAGVQGVHRFLKRVWKNQNLVKKDTTDSKELLVKLNQTIKGVTMDLENFQMNTVISKLMELNNFIESTGQISLESYKKFLILLSPVAPHIASEIWQSNAGSELDGQTWPEVDKKYLVADEIEIVIQINGKVRDKVQVSPDISDDDLKELALKSKRVVQLVGDREIKKTIVVPKKLVSIVIK